MSHADVGLKYVSNDDNLKEAATMAEREIEGEVSQSKTEKINFHRFDMLILRHTSSHCSGLTS